MVVACGIDIEELNRFDKHLAHFPQSLFVSHVLSEAEILNYLQFNPAHCLPLAFCCKEAVFKALGNTWTTSPIDWKDIELLFHDFPEVKDFEIRLSEYARGMMTSLGANQMISSYNIHSDHLVFEVILTHA